jgi:exosortase family protein XrtG
MIFFTPFLERQISLLISETLELIGNATTYFAVFKENSIISFDTRTGIISMFIDYECSGVIEMLVFTSLLLFFPFGKPFRKLFYAIGGNIFIFLANIIRILMIVFVSKTFGAEYFYIAHTLLGRLLFFGLMIVLYYLVFTVTHLKNQHVGELK